MNGFKIIILIKSSVLTLFYYSFFKKNKTTYSYIKIGFIDNLSDFGSEDIEIFFE